MTATTIYDKDGLADFASEGLIVPGASFIDMQGRPWLAKRYDEGGTLHIRAPYAWDAPSTEFLASAEDLHYPITFFTQRDPAHSEYGDPGSDSV